MCVGVWCMRVSSVGGGCLVCESEWSRWIDETYVWMCPGLCI